MGTRRMWVIQSLMGREDFGMAEEDVTNTG